MNDYEDRMRKIEERAYEHTKLLAGNGNRVHYPLIGGVCSSFGEPNGL